MNCRDFERAWNEQIDARGGPAPVPNRDLDDHAAACPACRALQRRYQVLEDALRAWGPPPCPPADLKARVLAAWAAERRTPRLISVGRWAAIAAAVAIAVLVGGRSRHRPEPAAPPRPARPWNEALAVATRATWSLARETSAPAARTGRRVLANAPQLEGSPWPTQVGPDSSAAWPAVRLDLGAGVRPLSESTRHAFGFLLPERSRRPGGLHRDHVAPDRRS